MNTFIVSAILVSTLSINPLISERTNSSSVINVADTTHFNIDNYPLSTAELGQFPYLTAPEHAEFINNVKVINFDANVIVTENDIFEVEGQVYRVWVKKKSDYKEEISNRYLIKHFEDQIFKLGGVKVFEGGLQGERYKQYQDMVHYHGDNGSFLPIGDSKILTYVIRHESGNIYITLEKRNFGSTSFQIVQEKPEKKYFFLQNKRGCPFETASL